jgi:catechol 2,3-dioxygenase-like lactoylglutathione lyase family enzyme
MTPLLQVFDMPAAIRFYCDVLEFEVAMTDGKPVPDNDWVLLRRDGAELMLNTAYESGDRPPAADERRMDAHRDTALYFGTPDVDAVRALLRTKGVDAPDPTVAPYGMKQLYVTDPDGYVVCFQWRSDQ